MRKADVLLQQQRLLLRSQQLRIEIAHEAKVLARPVSQAFAMRDALTWVGKNPRTFGVLFAVAAASSHCRGALGLALRIWWDERSRSLAD